MPAEEQVVSLEERVVSPEERAAVVPLMLKRLTRVAANDGAGTGSRERGVGVRAVRGVGMLRVGVSRRLLPVAGMPGPDRCIVAADEDECDGNRSVIRTVS